MELTGWQLPLSAVPTDTRPLLWLAWITGYLVQCLLYVILGDNVEPKHCMAFGLIS